jgi:hypothetical protein
MAGRVGYSTDDKGFLRDLSATVKCLQLKGTFDFSIPANARLS